MVATAAAVNHHPGGLFLGCTPDITREGCFTAVFLCCGWMESPGRFDGLQARHKPAKLLFFLLRLLPPERGGQTRAHVYTTRAKTLVCGWCARLPLEVSKYKPVHVIAKNPPRCRNERNNFFFFFLLRVCICIYKSFLRLENFRKKKKDRAPLCPY